MMDFERTETQIMLGDTVRALLRRDYTFEARKAHLALNGTCLSLWPRLAELGVLGVEIAESLGGSGGTFDDLASILPLFGQSLVVEPVIPTLVLGVGLIAACGTRVQQETMLPRVADGTLTLALAHPERQARDMTRWVGATACRNTRGWLLDGAKCVVLGGDIAGTFIVSARTSGREDDPAGISLFVVPRLTPGLGCRPYRLYDGSGAADLVLSSMQLPEDALLGNVDSGLDPVERVYDLARAALCAEAIGVMDRLKDVTLDYLRSRVQFGQPIGKFQALQHRMVDAHVEIELARSMALLAVSAAGDADVSRRTRSIAAAKVRVGMAARTVGQSAVQLHGGIALTEEYIAGHYFKRLTMIERLFGDVPYHLARFAAA